MALRIHLFSKTVSFLFLDSLNNCVLVLFYFLDIPRGKGKVFYAHTLKIIKMMNKCTEGWAAAGWAAAGREAASQAAAGRAAAGWAAAGWAELDCRMFIS